MSNFARTLRQTMTVARRDFVATVFTPTFLLFLLVPVIMASLGAVGGVGAANVAERGGDKARLVVVVSPERAAEVASVDRQLRRMFPSRGENARPALLIETPSHDTPSQARAQFDRGDVDVTAVLYGPLEQPRILRGPRAWLDGIYLAQLAEQVLRTERAGTAQPLSNAEFETVTRGQASSGGKGQVAFLGVFGLFFLTLLLAGQVIGTMAEERSNKVIEILAAAVPLESVFLGKLVGSFGVAVLFLAFWATLGVNLTKLLPPGFDAAISDFGPAVGLPAFVLLFLAYFTSAYLLLGAVFLGIGAQAATQRELQMLSLPITVFQVAMFGFATTAAIYPDSWTALAAQVFPFSSPFAMIGHAGNSPDLWPHLLALGWQALWVAITVTLGARAFRRGVLKSGSPKFRLKALVGK